MVVMQGWPALGARPWQPPRVVRPTGRRATGRHRRVVVVVELLVVLVLGCAWTQRQGHPAQLLPEDPERHIKVVVVLVVVLAQAQQRLALLPSLPTRLARAALAAPLVLRLSVGACTAPPPRAPSHQLTPCPVPVTAALMAACAPMRTPLSARG